MPEQALQRLMDGNRRYIANRLALDASPVRRMELAQGQAPFAMIFSCVDSRVPPELVFDQGLGDLLVIRTAGQVLDRAALGSLEFGVAKLNIPVLMVLGHEQCGAVKAAMDTLEMPGPVDGDIAYLVDALEPAVREGMRLGGDAWEQAGRAQVARQVEQLKQSPILAAAVECHALLIVGAWYSMTTGLIEIFGDSDFKI